MIEQVKQSKTRQNQTIWNKDATIYELWNDVWLCDTQWSLHRFPDLTIHKPSNCFKSTRSCVAMRGSAQFTLNGNNTDGQLKEVRRHATNLHDP